MALVLRIPKGSRLTWAELDGDFIYLSSSIVDLSASFANALALGVGANLLNSITSNQNVGGVTSGTIFGVGQSLESVLTSILVSYIPPTLNSLTLKSAGSTVSIADRDVGDSITVDGVTFGATVDSPTGNYPTNASLTGSGALIGTKQFYFGSGQVAGSNTQAITSFTYSTSTNGAVTFALNATRAGTSTPVTTVTTSVNFKYRNYLAASATVINSQATAQSVINSEVITSLLDTNSSWTATCDSNNNDPTKFTYIIYPSGYGDLTNIIQNGALPVLGAFTKVGTYSINNSFGASNTYLVYKSNAKGAFSSGVTLAIS